MLKEKSVSFVMTADELLTVDVTDPMSLVRRLLSDGPIHHLPVLEAGKLVGMISSTDLLRLGLEGASVDEETLDAKFQVRDVMEKSLVTLQPRDPLIKAARMLADESFHSLPVVDQVGELVGILTTRDLLRFVIQEESQDELG